MDKKELSCRVEAEERADEELSSRVTDFSWELWRGKARSRDRSR